jgi:hypothetical protein
MPTRQVLAVQPLRVIETPTDGVGAHGSPVTAQKSRYDHFPPAANGWETIHHVSNMAPPLSAEEEGLPT